ncbi:PIG-L family deacetylase [Paucibacter sp. APW11]|uniref:PIG-L family deacetylase n=1 Tax=Roseateles aquae TaxID=3077235 RepID=A0ABU3P5P1_9BURK|nr:PIG-L family deacetylase [Paucibacter sp. APW11]MDT8997885.1 PIG-L family deacetylase [Paucibacter sp. APW11]
MLSLPQQRAAHIDTLTGTLTDAANEFQHWHDWVCQFARLMQVSDAEPPLPQAKSQAPGGHCMIFSPHPDDECIVGALPLRLRQEGQWRVSNIAVTLGSRLDRRAGRWSELQQACELLGFDTRKLGDDGLEQVKPETQDLAPTLWRSHVERVAQLIADERPELILLPHAGDGIATHMGVHHLVTQALARSSHRCVLGQTEYWATQSSPNCMIETSCADTARLVQALAQHRGEVERNPYHLRLPAWMADNVRRGGEMIGGAGSAPPDFGFATLYQLSLWGGGAWRQDLSPRLCPAKERLNGNWLRATAVAR